MAAVVVTGVEKIYRGRSSRRDVARVAGGGCQTALYVHDPREHIRGIHQILISDKKRIGFLFAAGSSFGTGVPSVRVPAIAEMTRRVIVENNGPTVWPAGDGLLASICLFLAVCQ